MNAAGKEKIPRKKFLKFVTKTSSSEMNNERLFPSSITRQSNFMNFMKN